MRKLDPQLEYLVEEGAASALEFETDVMGQFGLDMVPGAGRRKPKVEANVLIQYSGDPDPNDDGEGASALKDAGLTIRGIAGDVVTGVIDVANIHKLSEIDEVVRVEAARTLQTELDLALPESNADQVHAGPPGRRGAGVIIGIVDTGTDFTHPAFLNPDGTTRILAIWDQNLTAQAGESAPAPFGYGVEYTQAQINAALAAPAPFNVVRHRDGGFPHGTHVAGIAAGNGGGAGNARPGGPENPAGTYVGVAPEADLIIVAVGGSGAEGLGTSTRALDAVNYCYRKAGTFDKACVVNMSLGDNLGPHDGTSLLERGLDNLLGRQGRAFVKSAGNAGNARIHAQGTVATGATENVRFSLDAGDVRTNQIDLWYDGADTFRVSIIDPTGAVQGPVSVGNSPTLAFPGGNTVRVDHRNNDAINGDKRVFMTFRTGGAGTIRAGTWTIRVQSVSSPSGGAFDMWSQRGGSTNPIPEFLPPHENRGRTISTPGTAREIITAANYSARGFSAGSLASSSSRGPTRDGRPAPTVGAPGTNVIAASAENFRGDAYLSLSGTSMSAPHIAGTIALMFQKNRNRTQAEVKACIENTARSDAQTGPTPNTAWGHGKLDAKAAVDCVPSPRPPVLSSVVRVACLRSIVATTCPSVIATTCFRLSVPITTCFVRSVARISCNPSVVTACVSQPRITCGGGRVSVPAITCGGPSVVDGCPSTPGGCPDPGRFVPVDPGRVVPVDPGGIANPGGFRGGIPGGFRPIADSDDGLEGLTADEVEYLTQLAEAEAEAFEAPEVPEEGYFEYDDAWFDAD